VYPPLPKTVINAGKDYYLEREEEDTRGKKKCCDAAGIELSAGGSSQESSCAFQVSYTAAALVSERLLAIEGDVDGGKRKEISWLVHCLRPGEAK